MTDQEIQQKLLEIALAEAKLWLVKIPKLDHFHIGQRILDCVVSKFKEHQVSLWSYSCMEVADMEYEVKVNVGIEATLLIREEEVDG